MIFPIVCTSFTLLLVPTLAFPTGQVKESQLNNLQKSFTIVEGPREFFVPVVPLVDTIFPRNVAKDSNQPNFLSSKVTDLDYMVYGKLYLMRALNIADRSALIKENNETPNLNYNDGISFPTTSKPVKRPYQYKWNKLHTLDVDASNGHPEHRKLEERSADQIEISENPISLANAAASTISNDNIQPQPDKSVTLDEEATELLQTFLAHASQINETFKINNHTDGETQGNISALNSTTDNIDIEDRFLINVPTKPNFTQCPQGQKRTHHGICKQIFVHKPSPNDGFFGGRIYAANGTQKKEQYSPSLLGRRDELPNLQWTTLLRSVVQIEKRLEKAIKETEKQLSVMVQNENEHNSSSTMVVTDEKQA